MANSYKNDLKNNILQKNDILLKMSFFIDFLKYYYYNNNVYLNKKRSKNDRIQERI